MDEKRLPKEWVQLVKQAMESDVTKEEFKKYLDNQKVKKR
ncbi:anti-repressor SinI family protein [Evansella sp. AB-P1]|nr:anti-repressor SinI family protein [Evansella sp. AB-P1]MDG5789289.1 anti-repressor SinI family protein [Evansella sp. AB-P1]